MTLTSEFKPVTHPTILSYAAQLGIPSSAIRRDGSFTLLVDGVYRVNIYSMPDGRIALGSRLLSLQSLSSTKKKDQLLEHLLSLSAGILRDHACTLCINEVGSILMLQQILVASTDIPRLKTAMAEFVNCLEYWLKVCRKQGME